MKKSKLSIALCGAALLLSSAAFAGDSNKATLDLNESVSVEGKTLNPGRYKVEWTGSGADVQVTVLKGKDTVATFPARDVEQPSQNRSDAYGSATQTDGTRSLTAIYIGGKHTVLEVGQNGANQQSSATGSK
jgi:hypothetical protein